MRTPFLVTASTFIAALNLMSAEPDTDPVLVFNGYSLTETNTNQVAKFEFRNTSHRTIWLRYEGRRPPLTAPFLERATAPVKPPNTNWVISASIGNWFTDEHVLLAGQSLHLDFPLVPGKAAVQVGIEYYLSSLRDDTEEPKPHQVWCGQAVNHQARVSDVSKNHSDGVPGVKSE